MNAPTAAFAYPTLSVDMPTLYQITDNLMSEGCRYGLGAKAPSLGCDTHEIEAIDCSGFVRFALYRASGVTLPDGSVNQHDWVDAQGFKRSSVAAAALEDGVLRIAFLSPADGGGVGHVMLVLNGYTLESHGHKGVDRRPWNTTLYPFMALCSMYVLTPPPEAV
jgi:cell wall-associated NlpC family hydrolase